MYLKEILETKSNIKFKDIKLNSKDIRKGDLFIPFGGVEDRNKYIKDAINKKCSSVITDKDYQHKRVFKVENLKEEIINIFNIYYNFPLRNTKLIGVTGTDGKTTIASIISDLLKCPSIGTNGFKKNSQYTKLDNTTPSIDILYKCFNQSRNYPNIVMEVSSEAYLNNRIGELEFDIGILSNITRDHLDKHKSLKNYINSKLELFKHSKISIINHDSKYYDLLKNNSRKYLSYGFNKKSDLRIIKYKLYIDSSIIWFKYKNKKYKVKYPLVGLFNVYNMACSILTLISLEYDIPDILKRVHNIKGVLGRMELVYNRNYKIIIDYAHTENSTLNVLKFYKKFNKNIITIVGCAGDRYKEKRKNIGSIVLKYSKLVIFTMDDPRCESVDSIIKDMISDTNRKNYLIIKSRTKAIEKGISLCKQNYILLILGKGRDNYMLINDLKVPYSDYETVLKLISN